MKKSNKRDKKMASENSNTTMDSYNSPNDQELPSVVEVFDKFLRMDSSARKLGTVIEFPVEDIIFEGPGQSAVKRIQVNICSTEDIDMSALHLLSKKVL